MIRTFTADLCPHLAVRLVEQALVARGVTYIALGGHVIPEPRAITVLTGGRVEVEYEAKETDRG